MRVAETAEKMSFMITRKLEQLPSYPMLCKLAEKNRVHVTGNERSGSFLGRGVEGAYEFGEANIHGQFTARGVTGEISFEIGKATVAITHMPFWLPAALLKQKITEWLDTFCTELASRQVISKPQPDASMPVIRHHDDYRETMLALHRFRTFPSRGSVQRRATQSPSRHEPECQRIAIAQTVGGFYRSDDGQGQRAKAEHNQQRNPDQNDRQRDAAQRINQHGDVEVQRFACIGRDVLGFFSHREVDHQGQHEADSQQGGEMTQHAPYLVAALGGQRRIGQWPSFHHCPFQAHPIVLLPVSDDAVMFSASLQSRGMWLNYRNVRALYIAVLRPTLAPDLSTTQLRRAAIK